MLRTIARHKPFSVALAVTAALALAAALSQFGWIPAAKFPLMVRIAIAAVLGLVAGGWLLWSRRRGPIERNLAYSVTWLFAWLGALLFLFDPKLSAERANLVNYGIGATFVVGLCWFVWLVETGSQRYEARRTAERLRREEEGDVVWHEGRVWHPLDPGAWYYGRKNKRLNQSLGMLAAYVAMCLLVSVILSWVPFADESYELPAGGGGGGGGGRSEQASVAPKIRVQKVMRKKFVINPLSSILFNAPPIDEIKLQLADATEHLYSAGSGRGGAGFGSGSGIGYGDGEGSGFGSGTGAGKVRFIRLEYAGGDWDQDFGVGADLNMLIQYGILTGQKVEDHTESRTIFQLKQFPVGKSPPIVFLTGQRSISLGKTEIQILREYLIDKHGMIFGDNGGSQHFHNQFFSMMQQILPDVQPVHVPLDDVIHKVPFAIPFLPYVAPHGGKDAWGWKVEGRWVCYYHPGDIGDAWSDGHSGVSRSVYEACYQLGANVLFYGHAEYHKWLVSRMESQKGSGKK